MSAFRGNPEDICSSQFDPGTDIDAGCTVPEAVFTSGLAVILFFRCLSEARLPGRVSPSGLCNIFKNFPVPVSQLRSSVIHSRISIVLRQRHPSGNTVGGADQ